jgi:hypothetical protein
MVTRGILCAFVSFAFTTVYQQASDIKKLLCKNYSLELENSILKNVHA